MFKPGDIVEALEDCPGEFTKGKEYSVRGYDSRRETVLIFVDNKGSYTNGWNKRFFRKIAVVPYDPEQMLVDEDDL